MQEKGCLHFRQGKSDLEEEKAFRIYVRFPRAQEGEKERILCFLSASHLSFPLPKRKRREPGREKRDRRRERKRDESFALESANEPLQRKLSPTFFSLFFSADSNQNISGVLKEFDHGGQLSSYNTDGVSTNHKLNFCFMALSTYFTIK